MIRRLALMLTLAATSAAASATAVVDRSLAEILDAADVVVYGRVAAVQAAETEDAVRTRVLLEVDRDLTAEEAPREELELSFLGGRTAAGNVLEVAGVPSFEVGDRVLVAAYEPDQGEDEEAEAEAEAPRLASPIVGVWQGLWRLGPNGLSDERGRLLTPTDGGLATGGAGGDLTEVLDAIAAWRAGEAEIEAASTAGADAQASLPDVPASPADPEATDPADAPTDPGDGAAAEDRQGDADEPSDGAEDVAPPADAEPEDEGGAVVRLRPPENEALRRTIEAAAASWRAVGAEVEVRFDDAAEDAIVLGDPRRLGPDALALSLRSGDAAGTEVRVSPAAAARTDVLAYELAVLAGAAPAEEGLLSGRFDADAETLPGREDANAFDASLERLPGDLDADGRVDFYDLALLGEQFGRTGSRLAADLDGDGRVGEADLERLRERYEFLPPAPDPPPGREGTPE